MTVASRPLLRFDRVTLGYRRRVVLRDVSLDVTPGSFVGLVGPNGSGKTTLLRAALGVIAPSSGSITKGDRLRVGYVPQRAKIDPIYPLRVRDVVMMGRYPHIGPLRRPRDVDHRAVMEACERVAITDLIERPFRDLSGGQQQRSLIARALAAEPTLLVLDEPTNGMDIASEQAILGVVQRLREEEGTTILFVTHLLNLLANAATTFALFHDGSVRTGARDEVLDANVLSELYGAPIRVHEIDGNRVIVAQPHSPFAESR